MTFSSEHLAELNLLTLFDTASTRAGLKVHQSAAAPDAVAAAARLYRKGLISQKDGGYLTSLGCEAAEHAQKLLAVLSCEQSDAVGVV